MLPPAAPLTSGALTAGFSASEQKLSLPALRKAVSTRAIVSGCLQTWDLHLVHIFSLQPQRNIFFLTINFWMMQWQKQPPEHDAGLPNHHSPAQPSPVYPEQGFGGPCALGTAQQGAALGEQTAPYSLRQHLLFLPPESHISAALVTERVATESFQIYTNNYL